MASEKSTSVLVVGAGPVGLVLALSLLRNGISVRIIERERTPRPGQRGAGIMPRSQELFHYLGVLPDVQAKALSLFYNRVYRVPGGAEPIKTYSMAPNVEPTPAVQYPNILALGQDNAEAILRSHIERLGCQVEFGTELRDFEQFADRVDAHVVKRQGDAKIQETISSHWLVGTDGARGTVRRQLGLSFLGETRGEEMWFVVGDLEVEGLDRKYWHFWGGIVMLRPTEEEGLFALILGGRIDHARMVSDQEELIKTIRTGTDRDDINVRKVRWLSEFRPNMRMVDTFGEGRVFVAGDAAHVHTPFGAQGMNSGIQDSFNLGWKLALVEKGFAAPSLLSTYTEERLPVIAAVLKRTTAILDTTASTMKSDGSGTAAWDRGGPLKQLGVNYRWSSIVVDERFPLEGASRVLMDPYGIELGDTVRRDPRCGVNPISLFNIFGPSHHTVMLFAGNTDTIANILESLKRYPTSALKSLVIYPQGTSPAAELLDADFVVVNERGHAYLNYACSQKMMTLAIVRPDGIMGGLVFGLDGLEGYFSRVFDRVKEGVC
ncbi:monooxygenase [Laetiporus sulphureus 93-53]|uniref:Monooxygenase n=1 Tax=Laetiporus sulphureus 93-53 TaxID=1314785 RepID=A0A165DQD3_9APHY|nr:monooxygenase [Laetiporus sulphureus 93-53]KZT05394.1 monooxygenase [Laetiporus sulphureus 93-53]